MPVGRDGEEHEKPCPQLGYRHSDVRVEVKNGGRDRNRDDRRDDDPKDVTRARQRAEDDDKNQQPRQQRHRQRRPGFAQQFVADQRPHGEAMIFELRDPGAPELERHVQPHIARR